MQKLNTRKQLLVKVSRQNLKTAEDTKSLQGLLQSGFQDDGIDISFDGTDFESTEEQNVQVV